MKNLIFTFLLMTPVILTGQSLFFSSPIAVSDASSGYRAPRIALVEGNRPVIYWGKTGSSPTLNLIIWEGGSFGTPITINTQGIEPDLWGGGLGPQIAAQGELIYLVFESYGEGIYCVKSDDGGQSFELPVSVFNAPSGRVATLPSVAIDTGGNPVISFVTTNFSEQNAQYEVAVSVDGGESFLPTTVANTAADGEEVCECCPASIATTAEGEVFLGFRNNDNNIRDIWIAKSSNGGNSFDEATDIDDTDWLIQSCPQNGPDMMINGDSIYTVFYSGSLGSNIYLSAINRNNMIAGQQFQVPATNGEERSQNHPSIAGYMDTIGVVWQEYTDNGWDIAMAWSTEGTTALNDNLLIIEDSPQTQRQPDIVFKDGLFHIVYEDLLNDQLVYQVAGFEPIVSTTSLVEREGLFFKVAPSLFTDELTIELENPDHNTYTLNVFNALGQSAKLIKSKASRLALDTSDWEKGMYYIYLKMEGMARTKKVVKH